MSVSNCFRQPDHLPLKVLLTGLGTLVALAPAKAQVLPSKSPPQAVPTYQMERPHYDAPGTLRNTILFHPSLMENFSYSDNIFASDTTQASDFISTTTAAVSLGVDWSRHSLTARGFFTQQFYVNHSSENASAFGVEASDRYSVSARSFLQIDAGFTQQPQSRATEEADVNAAERPIYSTTNGAISYVQRYGRLVDRAQIAVRKVHYLDDEDAGRSSVQYTVSNRIAYDLRGRLTAFADASFVRHNWETRSDVRDFDVLRGHVGIGYVIPSVMEAELGVGALRQDFVDDAFETLVTPTLSVNMTWNILPLTTILANAERTVVGTETFCGGQPALCQSGALNPGQRNTRETMAALLAVQHEFWHNFLGEVRVRYAKDRFNFNGLFNNTYAVSLNARYLVNRYLQLDLDYTHAARTANLPDDRTYNSGPYTENIVALTVRTGF